MKRYCYTMPIKFLTEKKISKHKKDANTFYTKIRDKDKKRDGKNSNSNDSNNNNNGDSNIKKCKKRNRYKERNTQEIEGKM